MAKLSGDAQENEGTGRERVLVVNADDFGLSPGTNAGVIAAYEQGIVTSASLMVRGSAAQEAARYGRREAGLSLGLHVDLGEWVYRDGNWHLAYEVVPPDDSEAVRRELDRQMDAFRDLVGSEPTHLDSHQHIHRSEPLRSLLLDIAVMLDVPLRDCAPGIRYLGGFYGQSGTGEPFPGAISVDALTAILGGLTVGITELGCHPGYTDQTLRTTYDREREIEVDTLSHPLVRRCIEAEAILLRSFRDLGRKQWSTYS